MNFWASFAFLLVSVGLTYGCEKSRQARDDGATDEPGVGDEPGAGDGEPDGGSDEPEPEEP